jgi:iron(III) transport system substrate-binding protein
LLAGFGPFKADNLSLDKLGQFNAEAVKLMDRAGWK